MPIPQGSPASNLSSLGRDAQCHQKARHYVMRGDRAGQLCGRGGVEMLLQPGKHLVAHLDVERHLGGVFK